MWSIDYVQVPSDDQINGTSNNITKPTPMHHRLVKQMHISNDSSGGGGGGSLMKSGSESSLSEDAVVRVSSLSIDGGSAKEWRKEQENEKEICSDVEENQLAVVVATATPPVAAVRRRRSRVCVGLRKSEGEGAGAGAGAGKFKTKQFLDNQT